MIIGLCGYARSGKDTVAEAFVQAGFTRLAFADALKDFALEVDPWVEMPYHGFRRLGYVVSDLGWEGAKAYPDVRSLLQKLGTGARSHLYDRVWIDVVADQIHEQRLTDVVLTDVRFPNEAGWIKERGTLVRVERPGVGPANGHLSESAIDREDAQYVINNCGSVDDLHQSARTLVTSLRLQKAHWGK